MTMTMAQVRASMAAVDGFLVSHGGAVRVALLTDDMMQKVGITVVGDWYRVEATIGQAESKGLATLLLDANQAMELTSLAWRNGLVVVRHDLPTCADADELVDAVRRVAAVATRWRRAWAGSAG